MRFCKSQSTPAPGPCDPRSSLAAVNHLFWFLPTRRLAAAPRAGAVGVGEMQGSWAGASPMALRIRVPPGPSPAGAAPPVRCQWGFCVGQISRVLITQGCSRGIHGLAQERLPGMKAQEGAQLGRLLECTVQGCPSRHSILCLILITSPSLACCKLDILLTSASHSLLLCHATGQTGNSLPDSSSGMLICDVPGPVLETLILAGVWKKMFKSSSFSRLCELMALCLDEEALGISDSFLSPSFFLFYSRKGVLGRGGNTSKLRQEKSFSGFSHLGVLHGRKEGAGQENQQERLLPAMLVMLLLQLPPGPSVPMPLKK